MKGLPGSLFAYPACRTGQPADPQDEVTRVEEVNQPHIRNEAAQVEANNWQLVRDERSNDDNLSDIDDVGLNLDNAQIQQIAG
uniref:Uncharacterized protein n=1 Tax=Trichogramma kaykai TaxID=54128 RepID=A0ABD2WZK8_9HYME